MCAQPLNHTPEGLCFVLPRFLEGVDVLAVLLCHLGCPRTCFVAQVRLPLITWLGVALNVNLLVCVRVHACACSCEYRHTYAMCSPGARIRDNSETWFSFHSGFQRPHSGWQVYRASTVLPRMRQSATCSLSVSGQRHSVGKFHTGCGGTRLPWQH